MVLRDATGPAGRAVGGARRGKGKAGGRGLGPGGNCVCPQCGETLSHERRVPCYEKKCPKCGVIMTRQ